MMKEIKEASTLRFLTGITIFTICRQETAGNLFQVTAAFQREMLHRNAVESSILYELKAGRENQVGNCSRNTALFTICKRIRPNRDKV